MQYPMVMPKKIRPSLCAAIPHLLTGFVLVKGSSDRSAVRPSKFLSLAFLVFKYQHPRLWTPFSVGSGWQSCVLQLSCSVSQLLISHILTLYLCPLPHANEQAPHEDHCPLLGFVGMHGTFVLQYWFWRLTPEQVLPFWHVRLRWRSPPWHVLLHDDQLPHDPQVVGCGHELSLQLVNWLLTPTQLLPPTQYLILLCLPPPQLALQALQLVHAPQDETTGQFCVLHCSFWKLLPSQAVPPTQDLAR